MYHEFLLGFDILAKAHLYAHKRRVFQDNSEFSSDYHKMNDPSKFKYIFIYILEARPTIRKKCS